MTKLLLIIAVTIGIVLWFKRSSSVARVPRKEKAPEDMVRCEVCQVNLPRSEAILTQGRFYCCDEHRLRGH